jgi:hypothetical protein
VGGLADARREGFRSSTKLILATTTASRHGEATFTPHFFVIGRACSDCRPARRQGETTYVQYG